MTTRNLWPATAATYALLLPGLRDVARSHGYALGLHGSLTTDLDLIAVPWTHGAAAAEALVEALRASVGGFIDERVYTCRSCGEAGVDCPHHLHSPTPKPHGRRAWSIHLDKEQMGGAPYIDISVMPRSSP